MIPRYQRILFWILSSLCVLMLVLLIWSHHRNKETADLSADDTPITAPDSGSEANVTYVVAHDSDGSLSTSDRAIALPSTPNIRTRALLEHLLSDYALPSSPHPLPGGIAVDDVFLVPLPLTAAHAPGSTSAFDIRTSLPNKADDADELTHTTGELAVINLRSTWVGSHPSGVQAETLTLMSILGTLHASVPEITHVRFLVDGQPRDSLAGHVDLNRTYESTDTTKM